MDKLNFQGKEGWYKFKKPVKNVYVLIMKSGKTDILNKIDALTSPETPFLEGSLKMLAETFGMAVSTLKEVLKRSNKLIKHTVGSRTWSRYEIN